MQLNNRIKSLYCKILINLLSLHCESKEITCYIPLAETTMVNVMLFEKKEKTYI